MINDLSYKLMLVFDWGHKTVLANPKRSARSRDIMDVHVGHRGGNQRSVPISHWMMKQC
jgi:hypothetical protein